MIAVCFGVASKGATLENTTVDTRSTSARKGEGMQTIHLSPLRRISRIEMIRTSRCAQES